MVALAGVSVFGQPTSNSPLDPPPNGLRRADSTRHALVNATVHLAPGRVAEKATVYIVDGRIAGIKADASTSVGAGDPSTAGAREWDCTGLHIYPAFIEPYLEIDVPRPGPTDAGRHWNSAVTPERRAADAPALSEAAAKELRELGFGAAVISPRGGNFRGTASVVSLGKRAEEVSLVKPPVYAEDVYQSVSFESSGGPESTAWTSYPSSEMGAIALVRQTLIDADWQARAREAGTYSGSVNALDALRPQRRRGEAEGGAAVSKDAPPMPLLMDCSDELDVLRAVKVAREFGRSPVILGSGLEFKRLAAIGELKDVPLVVPVNFPDAPKMASVSEADSVELREMMTWEQAPTNLRRLHGQGLEVALTTAKLRSKGKFWENVRTAIRHGLAPDDAMAMVTTVPAKLMGVSDQVGTIAVGMRANLTVTDGDWFDPHGNTVTGAEKARKPKIRDVWVDGQRHEVTAPPGMKLEGVWDVTLDPAPPAAAEGKFALTFSFDDDNKLSIAKYAADGEGKVEVKTVKPKEQKLEKNRLSYTFEHEPFGEPGVFIVQATVEGDAMYGDFIRSSGVRAKFSAKKRPPVAGIGEWRVIEFDGKAKGPDERDQVRLSITRDAVTLVFTDEAGKRTVIKGEDVKVGPDQKKQMEARIAGTADEGAAVAVTYKHDREKLGGKGKSTDTLRVDPANPDVLIGEGELPKEEGQDAAVKHSFKLGRVTEEQLAAEREARRPVGVVGTWRLVLVDDDPKLVGPKPEEPKYIVVDEQGGVVLKGHVADGKAIDMQATTRVFEDGRLAYDVDMGLLDPARELATVKVEGRRLNDLLIGTMVVPDGSEHTWKACRVAVWGDEPGEDDSDLIEAAMTPERFGYPFGPYAVAAPPTQQSVVVKGATIWTSGPQGNIENGTLVVTDGKVSMVGGPDLAVKMPEGTVVVDATGKHVTPGLIDCHSHTGISRGVNEGGQSVTAEVRIGDVTNPDAISWYRQLAGGITTVNNLHGSANPIGGQNQVNKNRWGATRPDDLHFEGAIPGIKFALGENVKQGNSPRVTTRYPRSRMGVETLIRDRFTAARQYIEDFTFAQKQEKLTPQQRAGARKAAEAELAACDRRIQELSLRRQQVATSATAPEGTHDRVDPAAVEELRKIDDELAGAEREGHEARMLVGMMQRVQLPFHRDLELEALAEILEGKRLVHCHSYRQDEILMLCRVAQDFGFKIGTFQHILEGYKVADELAKHSGGGSAFSDWWAYKVEVQDAIPQAGPIMHEQGVVVSYNSDSDEMARRMNVEAGKAVKYSAGPDGTPTISPEEALKFVTLNPAKQLKIDGRVGSLEAGKDADFVIWSGDPLSTMSKAEQTWIDGRMYFSLDQDRASREKIAAERARLTQKILGGLAAGKAKKDEKDGGEAGDSEGDRPREGGGRRRRGPQDEMGSGAEAGGGDDELDGPPVNWWMRRYYMEMHLRGLPLDAARPGECGCYGF
ncbi:MAG: hypothetical protein AMXMBFR58_14060 [Phycisphaerae bacterium]